MVDQYHTTSITMMEASPLTIEPGSESGISVGPTPWYQSPADKGGSRSRSFIPFIHDKITGLWRCHLCNFASPYRGSVRSHYAVHSNERPYACDMCPYEAKRSYDLKKHKVFKHGRHVSTRPTYKSQSVLVKYIAARRGFGPTWKQTDKRSKNGSSKTPDDAEMTSGHHDIDIRASAMGSLPASLVKMEKFDEPGEFENSVMGRHGPEGWAGEGAHSEFDSVAALPDAISDVRSQKDGMMVIPEIMRISRNNELENEEVDVCGEEAVKEENDGSSSKSQCEHNEGDSSQEVIDLSVSPMPCQSSAHDTRSTSTILRGKSSSTSALPSSLMVADSGDVTLQTVSTAASVPASTTSTSAHVESVAGDHVVVTNPDWKTGSLTRDGSMVFSQNLPRNLFTGSQDVLTRWSMASERSSSSQLEGRKRTVSEVGSRAMSPGSHSADRFKHALSGVSGKTFDHVSQSAKQGHGVSSAGMLLPTQLSGVSPTFRSGKNTPSGTASVQASWMHQSAPVQGAKSHSFTRPTVSRRKGQPVRQYIPEPSHEPDILLHNSALYNPSSRPPSTAVSSSGEVSPHHSSDSEGGGGGGGGGGRRGGVSGLPHNMRRSATKEAGVATRKSWHCPHCDILFMDSAIYLMHVGLHNPSHPWVCNLCDASLNDVYSFTSHFINHHR